MIYFFFFFMNRECLLWQLDIFLTRCQKFNIEIRFDSADFIGNLFLQCLFYPIEFLLILIRFVHHILFLFPPPLAWALLTYLTFRYISFIFSYSPILFKLFMACFIYELTLNSMGKILIWFRVFYWSSFLFFLLWFIFLYFYHSFVRILVNVSCEIRGLRSPSLSGVLQLINLDATIRPI